MFLESDIPELVILAVLGDFEGQAAEKVIRDILRRLQELKGDSIGLGKYLQQLEVLSKLRNLQPVTVKTIAAMPFVYDLETDIRYKQGLKKGLTEGVEKGIEKGNAEGQEKAKESFVRNLLAAGNFTLAQIADLVGVDVKFVKKVRAAIKKESANGKLESKNGHSAK